MVAAAAAAAARLWASGLHLAAADAAADAVAAAADAAAGAAAAAAADIATALASAGGFTLAANTAIGQLGGLLFSLGFLCIGLAYKGSDFKGALSFIPLGWLAILAGAIGLVSTIIIANIDSLGGVIIGV